MKRFTISLIIITGLFLCLCMPATAAESGKTDLATLMITMDPSLTAPSGSGLVQAASVSDSYPITIEQAKNNIRVFAGNLSIEPELSYTFMLPVGTYYMFSVDSLSSYAVNQNSGVVEFAVMGENIPATDVATLTRDEVYAKGTEFAQSKYEGFNQKNWKITKETPYNMGWYRMNGTEEEYISIPMYYFTLREESNHVLTPNVVVLLVNAVDGKTVYYGGIDRLLTVDLTPKITLAEAMAVAEEHFEYETTHVSAYLAVNTQPMNYQKLAWIVTMRGTHNDHEHTESFVVDAITGDYSGSLYNVWPEGYVQSS
ncbi:MAG: hypothetical protein WC626_14065, partial [Methanoregula sp.]